jgi:glycosyltransferase involved in cell wall biosynthesis
MRFLFVIDYLAAGGAQRQLTSLAVELKRRGHDVDVFVYFDAEHFAGELRDAGIAILSHPKPSRYSTQPIRRLRQLFRRGGYHVVLSFLPVPNAYCIAAATGLSRRPKIVVSERSFPRGGALGVKVRLLERFYPRADHITTNSHHMREHFRRRYGWGEDRVTTIWNGLDLDRFAATPLERHAGEPLRLLGIGRVDRNKNWRVLAAAAGLLRKEHSIDVRVSIVGRDQPKTSAEFKYRGELDAEIRRYDLRDAWTFLGERTEIAELLASHHALVHPSIVEGFANVICESLACGRPVIAGDAFDHRRLIQAGETGWLFDPHQVDGLVDALRRLVKLSPEELAAMGRKARDYAEQHLTVARLADEYEALFERLVGRNAARVSAAADDSPDVAVADGRRKA